MNNLDLLYETKNRLGLLDFSLALCIPLLVLNIAFTAVLMSRKEPK